MSSDVFRRVGRGGAGNWYSKKDVEEAEKQTAAPLSSALLPPQPAPYTHAGRGGAGNFYDAESVAAVAAERSDEAARLRAATAQPATAHVSSAQAPAAATTTTTSSSPTHSRPALSGRGGAGNWSTAAVVAQQQAEAAEQQRKAAALEAQIQQDVDAGLPPPPRTYHGA